MNPAALAGRRIAIPESRELDLLAGMVEKRGGTALRCPLVGILPAADPAPVHAWLQRFCQGTHEQLVVFTGEGLKQLDAAAQAADCQAAFRARLAQITLIARGPKPGRVLRQLQLPQPAQVADPATTAGVIALLQQQTLAGRQLAVQLYGSDPNQPFMDFLQQAGAIADPVAPYRYAPQTDADSVLALIQPDSLATIDAWVFTSQTQVKRLFDVARSAGQLATLEQGLRAASIASVGPLVTQALEQRNIRVDIMPTDNFHLKPMLNALTPHLLSTSTRQ